MLEDKHRWKESVLHPEIHIPSITMKDLPSEEKIEEIILKKLGCQHFLLQHDITGDFNELQSYDLCYLFSNLSIQNGRDKNIEYSYVWSSKTFLFFYTIN